MTSPFTKADIEAAAKAMKAALGKAWNAKPLLGDTKSGDWYADGGSFDLLELATAALNAAYASAQQRGAFPTDLIAKVEALEAEIEGLREALRPFAGSGLRHHTDETKVEITAIDADGEQWLLATLPLKDFRCAAALAMKET